MKPYTHFVPAVCLMLLSCSGCTDRCSDPIIYDEDDSKNITLSIYASETKLTFNKIRVFSPYQLEVTNKIPVSYAHDKIWIEFTDSLNNRDTLGIFYEVKSYYDYRCNEGVVSYIPVISYSSFPRHYTINIWR